MPTTKEFKTIEEQIEILESRKLKFKNKDRAKAILLKYNYFDIINGFESILLHKTSPKEFDNVFFEDFWDLYKFDMRLKKVTLFKVLEIESRLRTSIAYYFAEKNCRNIADTLNYTDPNYYKKPPAHDKHLNNVFSKFDLFKKTSLKHKSFIDKLKDEKSYVGKYVDPPFWVVIKSIPLGTLYYTFLFLTDDVKKSVLGEFNFDLSQTQVFEQAIHILKDVRNECAHLELITRFRLNRKNSKLNNYNDIGNFANLSKADVNYMDVLKTLRVFSSIFDIKLSIIFFYIKMLFKGRKKIADKILSKMGRKSLWEWVKL